MLSTVGAVVLGWALIRLVVGGSPVTRTAAKLPAKQTEHRSEGKSVGFGGKQHAPSQTAHEAGRGRDAHTPTQIPRLG